jgi:hypothetical protein
MMRCTCSRAIIERMIKAENIGHRLVAEMTREHVQRIMAKRADTPGAANVLLKILKVLMHFAIDSNWRCDDPTLRVKKYASGEHHTRLAERGPRRRSPGSRLAGRSAANSGSRSPCAWGGASDTSIHDLNLACMGCCPSPQKSLKVFKRLVLHRRVDCPFQVAPSCSTAGG